jgi:hypothetical protein
MRRPPCSGRMPRIHWVMATKFHAALPVSHEFFASPWVGASRRSSARRRPAVAERHLLVGVPLLGARRGASAAQQAHHCVRGHAQRRGERRRERHLHGQPQLRTQEGVPQAAQGTPHRRGGPRSIHYLTDLHGLDHRRPVDTDHPAPYVDTEHAALLTLVLGTSTVRKRRWEAALLAFQQLNAPTDGSGEPFFITLLTPREHTYVGCGGSSRERCRSGLTSTKSSALLPPPAAGPVMS